MEKYIYDEFVSFVDETNVVKRTMNYVNSIFDVLPSALK